MKNTNHLEMNSESTHQFKLYNIVFLIYCLIVFVALDLAGQEMTAKYDSIVSMVVEDKNGPGFAIQISKDGETIYQNAVGKANLELDIDMTPDHVFRIGSITKQFTTAAILKLQEEGKLSIQDELTKYIEDYPTHGNKITIENLMNHTSGIKSYTSMPEFRTKWMTMHMDPEELIAVFKDEPMDFKTGEKEQYNNSAYILLGYIIEKVSGKTYEDYIETEFFEPLGMKHSSYEVASDIIPNRAYGYDEKEEGDYINAPYLSMTLPYAAGSLLSTTDDLRIWHTAFMNDEVISAASRKAAHTSAKLNNGEETGYGFGWGLGDLKGSPRIGHSGGINGFLSDSQYFPEEKILVTVLSNCNCNSAQQMIMPLASMAIGKPIVEPKETKLDLAVAKKYVGKYQLTPTLILDVLLDGDRVKVRPTGQESVYLKPIGEHKFFIREISSELVFHEDVDGLVKSLTLFQGGAHKAFKLDIKEVELSAEELQKYIGTFEVSPGMSFVFREAAGILYGRSGNDESVLTPIGKHEFLAKEDGVRVIFTANTENKIDLVTVHMGGEHIAKRVNK